MISAFVIALIATASIVIITGVAITAKWVIQKIKERAAANKKHQIIFADTRETRDSYVKEQEKNHKEYSTKELDELCGKAQYVFADYDADTEEVSNIEGIYTNVIDDSIKEELKKEGGFVVLKNVW